MCIVYAMFYPNVFIWLKWQLYGIKTQIDKMELFKVIPYPICVDMWGKKSSHLKCVTMTMVVKITRIYTHTFRALKAFSSFFFQKKNKRNTHMYWMRKTWTTKKALNIFICYHFFLFHHLAAMDWCGTSIFFWTLKSCFKWILEKF